MSTDVKDYMTRSHSTAWRPLKEEGIDTSGIWVKPLKFDSHRQRPTTFLLRFDPEASYPYHNHPAGEELFLLEGSCTIEGTILMAGDYMYTPPGFKHSVNSATGCTILFVVPEEVEIL